MHSENYKPLWRLDRQMAWICDQLLKGGLTMHVFKSGRIELRSKASGRLIKTL